MIGTKPGPYEVVAKLGEGGPPSLAGVVMRELRRVHRSQDRGAL